MTDKEIIKALECCGNYCYCKECVYKGLECNVLLNRDSLDLINRQKAEIEKLEDRIFALNDTNKLLIDSQEIYWKSKVKEFAELLKKDWWDNRYDSPDIDFDCFIDDLVRRMTEEMQE